MSRLFLFPFVFAVVFGEDFSWLGNLQDVGTGLRKLGAASSSTLGDPAAPTPAPDPATVKHVLWPESRPRPSQAYYPSFYKSFPLEWVSKDHFPQMPPDVEVDVLFVTKPVFGLVGRATAIYHGAICFRVQGGPSVIFEYQSLDYMSAIAFPDRSVNGSGGLLHFPSAAVADYMIDHSGKTCPESGAAWTSTTAVGLTTGKVLNRFFDWSFDYAVKHTRYLVWRVLEDKTERTLIDSQQCFDFVFRGLGFLRSQQATVMNATHLPRTTVNIYASTVETLAFDGSVAKFFSSEKKVIAEWLQLSGEFHLPFWENPVWYWPAWYAESPYAGGNGSISEDEEFPRVYHKYNLAFPRTSTSKLTYRGVHHLAYPLPPANAINDDVSSSQTFMI